MEHGSKDALRDSALEAAAEGRAASDWTIPAGLAGTGPQLAQVGVYDESESGSPLVWQPAVGFGGGAAFRSSDRGGDGSVAVDELQQQLEELRLLRGREAAAAAEREAHWREQVEELQAHAAHLEQQAAGGGGSSSGGGGGMAAALGARCDALCKERDALRVILDSKVRVLVEDMSRSVAQMPAEVRRRLCCCCCCCCPLPGPPAVLSVGLCVAAAAAAYVLAVAWGIIQQAVLKTAGIDAGWWPGCVKGPSLDLPRTQQQQLSMHLPAGPPKAWQAAGVFGKAGAGYRACHGGAAMSGDCKRPMCAPHVSIQCVQALCIIGILNLLFLLLSSTFLLLSLLTAP
jgi:hypothetical protein